MCSTKRYVLQSDLCLKSTKRYVLKGDVRVLNKQPYFISQIVSVPHGLLTHLKTEHLHFLRQFGLHV